MRGKRFADICKADGSYISVRDRRPGTQYRNLFPRMIATGPCRVIAMISRDDQQIAVAQAF